MKNRMQILPTLLLCFLFLSAAFQSAAAPKIEKEKTIKAHYQLKAGTLLELSNKFGKVEIQNWDKNELEIVAQVMAWGKSEADAQANLDRITISHKREGDKIICQTQIEEKAKRGIIFDNSGFEVNYLIKAPASLILNIQNRFGNVFIQKNNQNSTVEVAHGNFTATELLGLCNVIEVKHGNASIGEMKGGKLTLAHGNGNVQRGGTLTVNNRHGNFESNEVQKLELYAGHGNVRLGAVGSFEGEIKFGNFNIKRLSNGIILDSSHGNCQIEEVVAGFENIKVLNRFGSVTLSFQAGAGYQYETQSDFGNISNKSPQNQIIENITKDNRQSIKGEVKGKGRGVVFIQTQHGNVRIK
ncbi:hypothetical protein [Hugenholtzia roseola]|uniref:hypothetical protein n=1 Tax=Hugenholtzia roseola TaxID=1002 RepID=UPI00040EB6C7|nr:hypothetical protein [Hugenholtzia roseola]